MLGLGGNAVRGACRDEKSTSMKENPRCVFLGAEKLMSPQSLGAGELQEKH